LSRPTIENIQTAFTPKYISATLTQKRVVSAAPENRVIKRAAN
jgi:hypothetical protein